MSISARPRTRALVRAAIVLGALYLGWLLRTVTVPLLAAYILTQILLPLRNRLQPRLGASFATLVALALALLAPLLLFAPTLFEIDQLTELFPDRESADALAGQVSVQLEKLRDSLPDNLRDSLQLEGEQVKSAITKLAAWLAGILQAVGAFLGGLVGIVSALLLVPVFTFYLLKDAPWLPRLRAELPDEWHLRFDRVLPRVQEILSRYFQSRLLVASAKGLTFLLLLAAGRLFLDLPGVYTLALLGGVLSLIPVIGPLIAFLALAGVCFVTEGLTGLLFAGGVYAIGETLEGYVFLPRLVGKGIGMGDLAILLAVFCGGTLFGMFGILIAVPAVAVSKVLYHEFLRPVMGVDTTTAG